MNNVLLVLPIVLPLLTAAVSLLPWGSRSVRWLGVIGAGGLLASSLVLIRAVLVAPQRVLVTELGGWPAPYGLVLVADRFSAIMVVVAGVMGFTVAVYSLANIDADRQRFGYYPLLHILLMGVCGAFLTGDVFNLYVWFEVMLIASFVLVTLGNERAQLEGAIKYVTLNLLSSGLFLAAVGILYGATGTLNMADIAFRLEHLEQRQVATTLAMLFLVAFGIKAAAFPMFFWMPASYHTPPAAVSALFAALLTKVGVYSLIRFFTLIFGQETEAVRIILWLGGLGMIAGVLGAVAQNEFRRILAFHSVSQIGYILIGLGLFTRLALAGSIYFIVHHAIVKPNLFLVSGLVDRLRGTYELKQLGGLYPSAPAAAVLFLLSALSLAGIPPLSGFFAKLFLVAAGLEAAGLQDDAALRIERYVVVGVALGVGLLTLFSMIKIWNEAFWKPAPPLVPYEPRPRTEPAARLPFASPTAATPDPREDGGSLALLIVPTAVLAVLIVGLGILAGPALTLALEAADDLLDRSLYIDAVLGRRP